LKKSRVTLPVLALCAALAAPVAPSSAATPAPPPLAGVSAYLHDLLPSLDRGEATPVLVHGRSLADARSALAAHGMTELLAFERIGVVGTVGTATQVAALRRDPGVTYVEGNAPVDALDATSGIATRGDEAAATRTGADGSPLTGRGVSIAVVDSGVDPTHPVFQDPDGTAVVANLKVLCNPLDLGYRPDPSSCTVRPVSRTLNTDALAVGGHGTAVSSVAVGRPVKLQNGEVVRGAAPGAKLVALSATTLVALFGTDAGLEWILEHHDAPCGAGVPASTCPPIRVVSNSYEPIEGGGGPLDEQSATVKLQRALVADGVVVVWAQGNSGGDGTTDVANPWGTDPTPGVISAGWYDDQGTGTRDGAMSPDSSRGLAGHQDTYPDVVAPAEKITTACRPILVVCNLQGGAQTGPGPLDIDNFTVLSGSSFAAPMVAGAVAQLFQAVPDATPAEIEWALSSTAHRFAGGAAYEPGRYGPTSFDKGHGLIDVVAAVDALSGA
jgi:serine protease AprX